MINNNSLSLQNLAIQHVQFTIQYINCFVSVALIKFYKFSGWTKFAQNAGDCSILLIDFENFLGVTPPTPFLLTEFENYQNQNENSE